jgi:arsenate reductase (thioredoxin)
MQKVLFICVHNAGRSQMAEAFFNHMANGKAIAFSAGSKPAETISPAAVQVMAEAGIDISNKVPRLLTPELLEGIDRVVTMGCGEDSACPAAWVKTEDWELEDPAGKPVEDVRRIRDEIERRVKALIQDKKELNRESQNA